MKVAEVIQGGPVDLAASTIKAGHIIEAIDGTTIDAAMDFYKLLNRKAGKFTLLSVYDPAANKRWDETVKPIDRRRRRRAAVQALGPPASGRSRQAVRRQDRLRPRPLDERRQHAHGLRGGARPQHRQGGASSSTRASTAAATSTSSCPTS